MQKWKRLIRNREAIVVGKVVGKVGKVCEKVEISTWMVFGARFCTLFFAGKSQSF